MSGASVSTGTGVGGTSGVGPSVVDRGILLPFVVVFVFDGVPTIVVTMVTGAEVVAGRVAG